MQHNGQVQGSGPVKELPLDPSAPHTGPPPNVLPQQPNQGGAAKPVGPSMNEIYARIMENKKASQHQAAFPAQHLPDQAATVQIPAGAPSSHIILPVDGSGATVTAIGLQQWSSLQGQGVAQGVLRSGTMEIIREMMVSGGGVDEGGMLGWGSMPQERFMEGLANDMRDIGSGQVPEVQGLRTTFQIERIVSGGEGDLQALVKEVVGQSGQCGNVGIPLVGGAGVTSALVQASAQSQSGQRPGAHSQDRQQAGSPLKRSRSDLSSAPIGPPGPLAVPPPLLPGQSAPLGSPAAGNQPHHHLSGSHAGGRQHGTPHGATSSASVGPSQGEGAAGHGGAGSMQATTHSGVPDLAAAAREAEVLTREVGELQGQLDMLLDQVNALQQENNRMKSQLLDTCQAHGIQAGMEELNSTIAMHHPAPMSDTEASSIAIQAFAQNHGDVLATVRHLLQAALSKAQTVKDQGKVSAGAGFAAQPVGLQTVQVPPPAAPAAQLTYTLQPSAGLAGSGSLVGLLDGGAGQVLVRAAGSGTPQIWAAQQQPAAAAAPAQPHIYNSRPIQLTLADPNDLAVSGSGRMASGLQAALQLQPGAAAAAGGSYTLQLQDAAAAPRPTFAAPTSSNIRSAQHRQQGAHYAPPPVPQFAPPMYTNANQALLQNLPLQNGFPPGALVAHQGGLDGTGGLHMHTAGGVASGPGGFTGTAQMPLRPLVRADASQGSQGVLGSLDLSSLLSAYGFVDTSQQGM